MSGGIVTRQNCKDQRGKTLLQQNEAIRQRGVFPGKFELCGANEIIGFDPTKPPGKSWWLKAITRDHIRYPDDPRHKDPWGGIFIRVLQGQRVLFTTPQMSGGFRIYVFEPSPSQIALRSTL